MKVKVFVNWDTQDVRTEQDLEKDIKERAVDIYEDTDAFDEFLEREMLDLTWVEIFEMTTETKRKITEKWKDMSKDYAANEIEEDWEEFELEV